MIEMNYQIQVKVIGIIIGKASGWDEVSDTAFTFYDFEVAEEYEPVLRPILSDTDGSITIDWMTGEIETYSSPDDNGDADVHPNSPISFIDLVKSTFDKDASVP